MTTVSPHLTVDDYLAAVRGALGPAQAAEHAELLDELAEHLAEAAGDGDGESIESRLGTPEAYAADFLSSAGIEPEPEADDDGLGALSGTWRWVRERVAAARASTPPELRPAWWVIRGWALVAFLTGLTADNRDMFPFPQLFTNDALSIAAVVGAVVMSVRIGRWGGWVHPLVTVVGVLGLAMGIGQGNVDQSYTGGGVVPEQGLYVDGRYVQNIWPFDLEGRALDGVLLFDQDGQPIDVDTPPDVGQPQGAYPRRITTYEYDPVTGQEREVVLDPPFTSIPVLGATPDEASTTTTAPPPAPG